MSDIQQAQEAARLEKIERIELEKGNHVHELGVILSKIHGLAKALESVTDFTSGAHPEPRFLVRVLLDLNQRAEEYSDVSTRIESANEEMDELRTEDEKARESIGRIIGMPV